MTVKAACSCKSRDEKIGIMFAATVGRDLRLAQSVATPAVLPGVPDKF